MKYSFSWQRAAFSYFLKTEQITSFLWHSEFSRLGQRQSSGDGVFRMLAQAQESIPQAPDQPC